MNRKNIFSGVMLAGGLLFGTSSCNKLLEVPPPEEIEIGEAFNDSVLAVAAVTGIYSVMIAHGFFEAGAVSYYPARSADDALYRRSTDYFALDSLLYTNADVGFIWEEGFHSLGVINTCIEGLQGSHGLSESLRQQLLGEAFFCRAFVNFYLVNLWGDAMPLILTSDVQVNRSAPSVSRQKVYEQILADLAQASALLTDLYTGTGRCRPNRLVATALLARVYLYLQRYHEAIAMANKLIGSNHYLPLPTPATTFLKDSREAIWQLMPPLGGGATGSVVEVYLYLRSASSLHTTLLAAFEPGDLRRQAWVVNNTVSGTMYTTSNKYKDRGFSGNTSPSEYYVVLRLAEQYLIRAEANTRLGNTAAAVDDLNVVRGRAGLPALDVALGQQQCMQAVEQERRVELFTEWGHRWFDLKRWPGLRDPQVTRADEVLGALKRTWQSTDQWYPVPRAELQANPFLVQNPGYPVR